MVVLCSTVRISQEIIYVNNRLDDVVVSFLERLNVNLLGPHQREQDLPVILVSYIFFNNIRDLEVIWVEITANSHYSLPVCFFYTVSLSFVKASVQKSGFEIESDIENSNDTSLTETDYVFRNVVQNKSYVYATFFKEYDFINALQRPEHNLAFQSAARFQAHENFYHKLSVNWIFPSVELSSSFDL